VHVGNRTSIEKKGGGNIHVPFRVCRKNGRKKGNGQKQVAGRITGTQVGRGLVKNIKKIKKT